MNKSLLSDIQTAIRDKTNKISHLKLIEFLSSLEVDVSTVLQSLLSNQVLTRQSDFYLFSETVANSVLTKHTPCYTPTCSDTPCYSPSCPNRLQLSLNWSSTIPPSILENVTPLEIKRQEAIYEFIQKEQIYSSDLNNFLSFVIAPIFDIFKQAEAVNFTANVLYNIQKLKNDSSILLSNLKTLPINGFVSSIAVTLSTHFSLPNLKDQYVTYAIGQVKARYYIKQGQSLNNDILNFVQESLIKNTCFRKLPLDHFLTSPINHLVKKKLLIDSIIKYSEGDELILLELVKVEISKILQHVDQVSGEMKTQSRYR